MNGWLLKRKGTSGLPNEYQEVEWIKGRINTGEELEPKDIEEVYEIVQYMEGYDNGSFFSNNKNESYGRLNLRYINDDYKMWFFFGGNNSASVSYASLINKKIKIQFTKNKVGTNGTMQANCKYYDENGNSLGTSGTYAPKANVDNWYNAFPDGLPSITLNSNSGGYKTYSFKKVGGKELIPCYRKSDTAIGMYDITNNVFIEATGTTAKGNDVVPEIETIAVNSHIINLVSANNYNDKAVDIKIMVGSILPSEYQQVEYLSSTGTQYINTGFTPNSENIRLNFDVSFNSTADQRFCGSNKVVVAMSGSYTGTLAIRKGGQWVEGGWSETITTNTKTNFDIAISSTQTIVKKDNVTMATYSSGDSLSGDNTFLLFVSRYAPRNYLYGNLYSFKIYAEDVLIRDFIPCYRKSDNEIGLYDIVNDVFYTNAGTGVFTKGNNVYN